MEGRDKGLGFYPNYGRTQEVNEIPHVNIHAVPAACAGSCKYWLSMSLFIDSCFLLEHSFPGPLVYYLSVMNLNGRLSSRVTNDPRRRYSSKNHEEVAAGTHLETESHRRSSSPTRRGPIRPVWGLKVSSFQRPVSAEN